MRTLVTHTQAIKQLLPVLGELGLTFRANQRKATLQLDQEQLKHTKLRLLTRAFLQYLAPGTHVEVYVGKGYVTYCFLKEE